MVLKEKVAGPDFNEARRWTEQQIRAGRLDLLDVQANLVMHGFLAPRTDAQVPKTLDRETFDALVKFQTAYRDAVSRMDPVDKKGIKPITVDGKAGNQTQEMIMTYNWAVVRAKEATEIKEATNRWVATGEVPELIPLVAPTRERGPLAKVVPVKIGKRIPEQLTEDAAMARMSRIVETKWAGCTITGSGIGNWDYSHGKEGTYDYTIRLAMPDGKIFELAIASNKYYSASDLKRPAVKEELKQLTLATIRGYGETGELRKVGTNTAVPVESAFSLLTSATIIEDNRRVHRETQLYSYKEGATDDLKREKYGEGINYLVRIARELKSYDRG